MTEALRIIEGAMKFSKAILMWPHPIEAVIFDTDGVLCDSIPLYTKAIEDLAPPPYPDELVIKLNGQIDSVSCQYIADYYHINMSGEELAKLRFERLQKLLPECPLVPGVEDLVKELKKRNILLAIGTGSARPAHELKTINQKDFFSNFVGVVCGTEVPHGKPAPDVYLKARELFTPLNDGKEIPVENILVFEDAYQGIRSANLAGMPSVLLHRTKEDIEAGCALANAKPTYIINDFSEFDFSKFEWKSCKSNIN